jgi:hypothetical protein
MFVVGYGQGKETSHYPILLLGIEKLFVVSLLYVRRISDYIWDKMVLVVTVALSGNFHDKHQLRSNV